MTVIEKTLEERGGRYGVFADQAAISLAIKAAMEKGRHWQGLAPDQREALDMIAVKIARILNGDPNFHDSWHDIVGYAKLVADRLHKQDQSWAAASNESGCRLSAPNYHANILGADWTPEAGAKPNLPDDTLIDWRHPCGLGMLSRVQLGGVQWGSEPFGEWRIVR